MHPGGQSDSQDSCSKSKALFMGLGCHCCRAKLQRTVAVREPRGLMSACPPPQCEVRSVPPLPPPL